MIEPEQGIDDYGGKYSWTKGMFQTKVEKTLSECQQTVANIIWLTQFALKSVRKTYVVSNCAFKRTFMQTLLCMLPTL